MLGNRYRIEEQLGAGGMAVVFRAQDQLLERAVAVKILRQDFSQDPAFRERFRQEAKAAANLTHPNIVTIYDFDIDHEHLYIVMEYLPGKDLKTLINQEGKLSVDDALHLMIQACAGIGYAHRAGLVHCDIKPHNMLVSPDLRLKVTDFGIARALASIQPDEKTDYVWGSPQYFSPEQATGAAPSLASDVYSLGVILYEMLTGQLPFPEKTLEELTRRHRESLAVSPRRLNPEIPPVLEQIILKVLAKEPSARYRTADQLGRVLINLKENHKANRSRQEKKPEPVMAEAPPIVRPVNATRQAEFRAAPSPPRSSIADIDWLAVLLSLLALLAVGGLIPFWLWVYFVYNPPVP